MMGHLRELYQEMIVDHNHHPRNHYVMPDANAHSDGFNPLCGDRLTVYLSIKDGRIEKISFKGEGCAISQASASLMTEVLLGKTEKEAEILFELFHTLLTKEDFHEEDLAKLGKSAVLAGVKAFPARVKCATLAWHTLHAALSQSHEIVTTEE